ncbi:MAG: CapA family protein, partial [Actinomycetes bacterium]
MRRPTKVATAVAAASLLVACAGEPETVSSTPTSDATTSAAASTSPPAPTEPVPPPPTAPPTPEPLTIAFVGDINFEGDIGPRLEADPASVFGPARDLLGQAD